MTKKETRSPLRIFIFRSGCLHYLDWGNSEAPLLFSAWAQGSVSQLGLGRRGVETSITSWRLILEATVTPPGFMVPPIVTGNIFTILRS